MGLKILPGDWQSWAKYWAFQPWSPTPERWVPSASLKTSGIYWRTLRNWDSSHDEHKHLFAYSWEQGRGRRLKTAWGSGWFAATSLVPGAWSSSTRAKAVIAKECAHLIGNERSWLGPHCLWPLLVSAWRQQDRNCLGLWEACWDFAGVHPTWTRCLL